MISGNYFTNLDEENIYDELKNMLKESQLSEKERHILLALLHDVKETYRNVKIGRNQWVSALDAVNVPVFLLDSELRVLRANRTYANLAGVNIHDIVGKLYWKTFPLSESCLRLVDEKNEALDELFTPAGQVFLDHNYTVRDEDNDILYTLHVLEDITEQKKLESAYQDNKSLFNKMLETANDAIIILNNDGRIGYWNDASQRMFGYSKEEAVGQRMEELIVPAHLREEHLKGFKAFAKSGDGAVIDKMMLLPAIRKDGSEFQAEHSISAVKYKNSWHAIGIVREVTERIKKEQRLERLISALSYLRQTNKALIYSTQEDELLKKICDILTGSGDYIFAWVGYAQNDTQKHVLPVAFSGDESGYLDNIEITWSDDIHGRGPTGTAVRTSSTVIAKDIETHQEYTPWREDALKRSYRSSIALPLLDGKKCFGALNIYSAEPNSFDEEAVSILSEMAHDLSFGIVTLRNKADALLHERQMVELIEKNPDAIFVLDKEGNIEFCNPAAEKLFGKSSQNLAGTPFGLPMTEGESTNIEVISKNKNGRMEIRTVELRLVNLNSVTETKVYAFLHDVTDRLKAEKLHMRMGQILEQSWNEICVFDMDTLRFIDVSSGALEHMGYTIEEMREMTPMDIMPWLSREEFESMVLPLEDGLEKELHFETEHRRKDGTLYPVEARLQLSTQEDPPVFIAISQDITERKNYISKLENKVRHDDLTGLPNRLLLQEVLEQSLILSRVNAQPLALLSVAVQRLDEINDLLGHDRGDLLLCEVANRLQLIFGERTAVARQDANVFIVVLLDADSKTAQIMAQKIHDIFQLPAKIADMPIEIETVIGIALYPENGADSDTLLRHGDIAMRIAKKNKLHVHFYNKEEDPFSLQRLKLHGELRKAIKDRKLQLYYQPQVDIDSARIVGVEALARWPHESDGMISPNDFIPMVEQSGMINPFTYWVLEEAIAQLRRWMDAGIHINMSVNLSTRNLLDNTLVEKVAELLVTYEVSSHNLCLEITESAIMSQPQKALYVLNKLHHMGIKLSIDDYGTGYSSLAYLQKLPIDELKIDQSFTFELSDSKDTLAIVKSTIYLAHTLGMKTVAEGVRCETCMEILKDLGCDIAQGYYLSRPLPSDEIERWMKDSQWGITEVKPP